MQELTRYLVEQWIKTMATGEFHYTKVLDGNVQKSSYNKLRKIMFDLCQAEVCESIGRRDGIYRPIQDGVKPLQWQNSEAKKDFPIDLPFDLRKYVFIYPNTGIVVAGAKSSGKTGFLYRTITLNMNKPFHTVLLTNLEGGKGQLRDRFYSMTNVEIPKPAPFDVIPVTENFHDYIKEPNTLYVIDYIDAPDGDSFYLIGALITKAVRKLRENSVALIGLQKPTFRDIAFGGEGTLKDATLYLAMDSRRLKIVDAKVPTDSKVHPKNMQWSFSYDEAGTNFTNITRLYGQQELGG